MQRTASDGLITAGRRWALAAQPQGVIIIINGDGILYELEPSMFLMFEFDETRTTSSDEAYGAIGRALTFATRFESNCRALAAMDAVKHLAAARSVDNTRPTFDEMIANVAEEYWDVRRLRHHAQSIALTYKMPSDVRHLIQAAREARNTLAHDFTLGISYELEKDHGRMKALADLEELTAQIAEGDRIVALIMQIENGDPLPSTAHFASYVRRAVSWVCEVAV